MGFKNDDRCLAKVADDEPIFVLRAQDATAPEIIFEWVRRNRQLSNERQAEAETCAIEMRRWQNEHPDRTKRAD